MIHLFLLASSRCCYSCIFLVRTIGAFVLYLMLACIERGLMNWLLILFLSVIPFRNKRFRIIYAYPPDGLPAVTYLSAYTDPEVCRNDFRICMERSLRSPCHAVCFKSIPSACLSCFTDMLDVNVLSIHRKVVNQFMKDPPIQMCYWDGYIPSAMLH